jgi:hypothetical protein
MCKGSSEKRAWRSPMLCFAILAIVVSGCGESGPELAPVEGTVTLDGRPLESADVIFQPEDQKPASFARTGADGHYELMRKRGVMGASIGQHTVRITIPRSMFKNPPEIPTRYNTDSELKREVKSGEDNEFNFDLTSDKK